MKRSARYSRFGLSLALLMMLALVLSTTGCESAGAGAGTDTTPADDSLTARDYLTPSLISASLVGGPDSSQSSIAQFSATAFDPETFYQEGWYEYAEFIVVPELAYNYNGRFGADSGVMELLEPVLSDTSFSEFEWAESTLPDMYRTLEDGDTRVLHINETGSHYVFMYHNGTDSTEWLEVQETSTYKRTMWLQEFAYDSIDMVEITEFDDYVFTRSIRFFDRFAEDGSPNESINVQVFGGIHRADDPEEQILGVLKRSSADTTTSPWTVTENESQRAVAAFDLTNLMIRPSVEELLSSPFLFPYDQFSTYELAGCQDNGQWRSYDAPQEEGGEPVGPQEGESFVASEFVTLESVLAFLESGLLPEDVLKVNILGIGLDQIPESGILDFPDWQRTDVVINMGS